MTSPRATRAAAAAIAILSSAPACGRTPETDRPAQAPPGPPALTVSPTGVGPVRIGVTLAELNATLGEQLHPAYDVNPECDYVDPAALPPGIALMVEQDTVVRIDVDTTGIPTAEGAQVGDTEQHILELYKGRVEVQPHKYTGPVGHYLVVKWPSDSLHLLIFETDGQKVLNYRAGVLPAVQYVEGCA